MEIVIILMVVAATGLFVLPPLLAKPQAEGEAGEQDSSGPVSEAISRRDSSYDALADLELDHAGGKISTEDYQRLRTSYQRDAARALQELDQLQQDAAPAEGAGEEP